MQSSMRGTGRRRVLSALIAFAVMLCCFASLSLTQAQGENDTVKTATGLSISGGQENVDFRVDTGSKMILVTSDAPLTFSGTSNGYGIRVNPGVKATIILAGVTISAPLPLDVATNLYGTANGSIATEGSQVINKTSLFLILADSTTNTLTATGRFPALHCGEGSILVIDDSVVNRDDSGAFLTPEQGRVPRDCTLENGTQVKKGQSLHVLESAHPGKLVANGGKSNSAIGSGALENSGDMTFNGGVIEAHAYGTTSDGDGTGAGIGGAVGGGCTVMTFNGGIVDASGSYHGAGIGAGIGANWGSPWDQPQMAGTIKTRETNRNTICRDIYINGGNIKATGYLHGNAFGAGCSGGKNTGHEFVITGGNLIPVSQKSDIGAEGTDIIVTGGSFYTSKFQGTVTDGKGTTLAMATIDLSSQTELKNALLQGLEVEIDGVPLSPSYGLANNIDANGKLYFWLPASAQGHSLTVSGLSYTDPATGEVKEDGYDFVLPNFSGSNTTAKRYVEFEADESLFDEATKKQLYKVYDGKEIDSGNLLGQIAAQGIEVDSPAGGHLTDAGAMSLTSQRTKDKDGNPLSEPVGTNSIVNAGEYALIIDSSQFSSNSAFAASYWGHRAKLSATILAADSASKQLEVQTSQTNGKVDSMDFSVKVRAADDMATTCKAPDGTVQFYINGVAVGAPVALVAQSGNDNGFAFSLASFTWDMTGAQIPERADGKLVVTAQYAGGTNYKTSKPEPVEMDNPGVPTVQPPEVTVTPDDPSEPSKSLEPDGEITTKPGTDPGDPNTLHKKLKDYMTVQVSDAPLSEADVEALVSGRYTIKSLVPGSSAGITSVVIYDKDGSVVDHIDRSSPTDYHIVTTITDDMGNTTTVDLTYHITKTPDITVTPDDPNEPGKVLVPDEAPVVDENGNLHSHVKDSITRPTKNDRLSISQVQAMVDARYDISTIVPDGIAFFSSIEIKDSRGNVVDHIDLHSPTTYQISTVVEDSEGNTTTILIDYHITGGNIDSSTATGDHRAPLIVALVMGSCAVIGVLAVTLKKKRAH